MANTDAPRGFRPINGSSGGTTGLIHYHPLISTNAAIGLGDQVKYVTGNASGVVDLSTASTAILGVAAEAKALNAGATTTNNTNYIAVWDSPDQLFMAQTDDGTGTASTIACVGLNIDIVATAPSGGESRMELDESSATTTATLPWKIMGLYRDPKNAFGEFNKLIVRPNNHFLSSGTGTTAL